VRLVHLIAMLLFASHLGWLARSILPVAAGDERPAGAHDYSTLLSLLSRPLSVLGQVRSAQSKRS
jgi:hypothetical protein